MNQLRKEGFLCLCDCFFEKSVCVVGTGRKTHQTPGARGARMVVKEDTSDDDSDSAFLAELPPKVSCPRRSKRKR